MSKQKPSPEIENPIKKAPESVQKEIGGFENKPEPTRYGDWDVGGRCSDF
jgi:shikimate dehydrogenase